MITERHEELAALNALGLLEDTERHAFESELAGNRDLAALAASLGDTVAHLAFLTPPLAPPATLRGRIFAPWGVAAGLAVTAGWLALQNLSLHSDNAALRTERRLAEIAWKTAGNQLAERSLLAETMIADLGRRLRRSEDLARLKVSALASLAGNTKEAQAIAVWDPDQQAGLLTLDKMPAIDPSQDYQIWVVDPAYPNPVNGGVFHIAQDGSVSLAFKPDQPVTQAAAFAISLEKKGGVPKAEGPIVLLGKVPPI